jgi:hypothetical protein
MRDKLADVAAPKPESDFAAEIAAACLLVSLHLGNASQILSHLVLLTRLGSPPPLEAETAEAEEADQHHRPGRGFGRGGTRQSECRRGMRHDEVERHARARSP